MSHPPQPVTYQGRYYASLAELKRETGLYQDKVQELKRSGEIAPAARRPAEAARRPPTPRRRTSEAPGHVGAARRILAAAETIQDIAEHRSLDELAADATRVSIDARRRGLLKALWYYRQRYGHGVMEAGA